jgi:hypothetical protein
VALPGADWLALLDRLGARSDRSWMRAGPCADCSHFPRCQGNSMHLWDGELGHTAQCTLELVSGAGGG